VGDAAQRRYHLVLPSLVLGMYISGIIARITRSSLLEVLNTDYVRTARAKGQREFLVIMRHGLSNALIPVVTLLGVLYGNLLAGAVLTEAIFAWPGIGRYAYRASTSQDFPAIMGVSMLIALIYVVANFVVDLLYFFIDPSDPVRMITPLSTPERRGAVARPASACGNCAGSRR
jgi:peptide/nickel transport system permease protein